MSLAGKNFCFVESSAFIAENHWMLKHKYKIQTYSVHNSLPELKDLLTHDAAVIHLAKETRQIERDIAILRGAFNKNYPMAILVSLLSADDRVIYETINSIGIQTFEKRAEGRHFLDSLDYLNAL